MSKKDVLKTYLRETLKRRLKGVLKMSYVPILDFMLSECIDDVPHNTKSTES